MSAWVRPTLVIERICSERGVRAMISRKTGISEPAVSRIVRGLEPPYPKRGREIAEAIGWPGDWRALFEPAEGPDVIVGGEKFVVRIGDDDGEDAAEGGIDGGAGGEGDSM